MENEEKHTIVHGDQNIFRDNSRLVKVVVQGGAGFGNAGTSDSADMQSQDIYRQAGEAETLALEADSTVVEFPKIFEDAPSQVFVAPSEFTKKCCKVAVDYCYKGQPTQLAYVMVACFAYRLSNSLSSYKAFVRSLMLWGVIPYDKDKVEQIANTMGVKVKSLHPDFRKWGSELESEKAICTEIGRLLEGLHCHYRY